MTLSFKAFPVLFDHKSAPDSVTAGWSAMAQCKGKGCQENVTDADSEASSLTIAANIPAWIVKRPERRAPYARRVFGPRCQTCRAKLIKELHA